MSKIEIDWNDCKSGGHNMNEFTAIIRTDFRVSRGSVYDLRVELIRLVESGLVKIDGDSKEILVVRGKEFIGWMSMSYSNWVQLDAYLERPTSDRERVLWQMLVDLLD